MESREKCLTKSTGSENLGLLLMSVGGDLKGRERNNELVGDASGWVGSDFLSFYK